MLPGVVARLWVKRIVPRLGLHLHNQSGVYMFKRGLCTCVGVVGCPPLFRATVSVWPTINESQKAQ